MEIMIAVFVGVWVAAAGALSYKQIKKEFDAQENERGKAVGEESGK